MYSITTTSRKYRTHRASHRGRSTRSSNLYSIKPKTRVKDPRHTHGTAKRPIHGHARIRRVTPTIIPRSAKRLQTVADPRTKSPGKNSQIHHRPRITSRTTRLLGVTTHSGTTRHLRVIHTPNPSTPENGHSTIPWESPRTARETRSSPPGRPR